MYFKKFDKKFADSNVDEFIFGITRSLLDKQTDKYVFDFTDTEYIGNQELLVLTAFLKLFFESKIVPLNLRPHVFFNHVGKLVLQC
jgi:hypothetical protein